MQLAKNIPTRMVRLNNPETPKDRRLDIQGLRAIAVLMVVTFHAGLPVSGGFVGVDVFFVISGFVITSMLQREWATTGRINFGTFFIRRFKRLTPALALVVTVVILTSALVLSPLGTQQIAARTGIGAMLLVANFVIARVTGGYFDAPATTNPLLNVWSLSVEEQFYLAFPAVLAVGWSISGRSRSLWAAPHIIVLSIAVVSFGVACLNALGFCVPYTQFIFGFYCPVARAWEFATGALLSLAASRAVIKSRELALAFGLLGAVLLITSLWLISGRDPFPGPLTLLPVIGTVLLLLAGSHNTNLVTRTLSAKPIVKIGDYSYSIYLWHWPLIVFATCLWPNTSGVNLAAAVLAFAPALVSYKSVEQPIRMSKVMGWRFVRIALTTMLLPLAASGALIFAAGQGFWSPTVIAYQAAILTHHAGAAAGCDTSVPLNIHTSTNCTWNSSESGAPIYLVGDSNADHFSEAVIEAGASLHRPVVIGTSRACPFVGGGPKMELQAFQPDGVCSDYLRGTLKFLESSTPGFVIIAMSDKYWFKPVDRQERIKTLSSDVASIVTDLQRSGQKVMLIQSTPKWHDEYPYNPLNCSMLTVLGKHCSQEMPRAWAERAQIVLRQALTIVASQTGAALLDPWASLCPDAICYTQISGLIRYRDETHISVAQSEALAPMFAKTIASAK